MKTLKKIFAVFFLITGLSITVLFAIDLVNPNTTAKDKEDAVAAALLFGLPSTAVGAWLVWSLRQQHQQEVHNIEQQKEQIFLKILQAHNGEIMIAKFALETQMSIQEAKEYLDLKAQQLDASFEPGNEGGIIYKFTI